MACLWLTIVNTYSYVTFIFYLLLVCVKTQGCHYVSNKLRLHKESHWLFLTVVTEFQLLFTLLEGGYSLCSSQLKY